jgi:hypothetical protein
VVREDAQPVSNRRVATANQESQMCCRLALLVPRRSRKGVPLNNETTISGIGPRLGRRACVALCAFRGFIAISARTQRLWYSCRRRRGEKSAVRDRMRQHKSLLQHFVCDKSITFVLSDSDPHTSIVLTVRMHARLIFDVKGLPWESQVKRSHALLYYSGEYA